MDLGLTDTLVLITGGSKGIGLACAMAFAAEGARIALVSRDEANLARASVALREQQGVSAFSFAADLRQAEQAAQMAAAVEQQCGAIAVLVNSAGAALRTPPAELTAAHWHAAMDAKYFTTIHAIDAVLPGMVRAGGGAIVNIVGMGGKQATPTHLPGGAANAALMLASVGLANAFAGKGVRVNAVNPGLTATDRMHEGLAAESRLTGTPVAELMAQRIKAMPLGRIAQASDIADMVVFLASRRAAYVSGAVISLDGAATPIVV
jgi:NAD(P)-dependent dehydrogenase (short-subunit alcohol dehydrogenase family)